MKCIIFDLDGTLLYTLEDINDAINFALSSFNIRKNSLDETKTYVGNGAKDLVLRSIYHRYDTRLFLKNAFFDEVYKKYQEKYSKIRMNKTRPYDGIVELLNDLANKGYLLAVLSNKPDKDCKEIINKYFPNIFNLVVGQREGIPLKPNPYVLEEIMNKLDITKEDIIYVGDSLVDIEFSKNANIKCVSVSYGYCLKDILKLKNDLICDNVKELGDVLNDN